MSTPRNELDRPGIHPETPLSPKDFCSQALTKLKEAGFPFDQVINSCLYLPQTMTDAYQAQRPNCVDVLLVCSPEMIEPTAPVSVFADGPNNTLNIRLHPTIREININSPPIKLPDPKRSGEHLTIDAVRKTVHPDFRTTDELLELGSLENGKKGVLLIGVYKDKEGVKGSITWMETPQDYQRRYFEHSRALDQNGRPIEQQFMVAPPLQPDIKLSQSVTPAAGDKPKVLPVIKSEPLTPKPQDRLLETVNSAIRFEARGLPPITPPEAPRRIQRLVYGYHDKSTIPPAFPADFAEILKHIIVADCRNFPSSLQAQLKYLNSQQVEIPIFVTTNDVFTLSLNYSSLGGDGSRSYEYSVDKNRVIISSGTIGLGETRSGYYSLPLLVIKPHGGIGLIEMGSENLAALDQAFDEKGNLKPVNAELFRPSPRQADVRKPALNQPLVSARNLKTVLAPFPSKEPKPRPPEPKPAPRPVTTQIYPPTPPPVSARPVSTPRLVTPRRQDLVTNIPAEPRQQPEPQAFKTQAIADWLKKLDTIPEGKYRCRFDLPRYKMLAGSHQEAIDLASCISQQGQGELTIIVTSDKRLEVKVEGQIIYGCDLSENLTPSRKLIEYLYLLKTGVLEKNMPRRVNTRRRGDFTPSDAHRTLEERLPGMRQAFAKVQVAPPRPKPASPVKPLSRAEFEELKREHGWK